jgi:catechol 2,3-dioxygenase-like lactoylglutathione lyase family enzyme
MSVDMRLEVVVIPVSNIDSAKRFYSDLRWRLDGDFVAGDDFRGVQFTPPGSSCSIHFGKGITTAAPGSASGLYLVVSDIQEARAELGSFVTFSDPDGNSWLLQEVTQRFPGRVDAPDTTFTSSSELASAFRRAEAAHGEHEKRTGQRDANWPDWYAEYMVAEQSGKPLPT